MLLREKIVILILVVAAYVFLLDQITPLGNQAWENHNKNTSRYAVMQKGKVGFINGRGRLIVPMKYDEAQKYSSDGLILTRLGKSWGFINHPGEVIIPHQYVWAQEFSQGLAAVAVKPPKQAIPLHGFINTKGEEIIPLKYQRVRSFTENNLAAFKEDSKWGYVSVYGNIMILPSFEEAGDFHNNLAPVKIKGLWGYINVGGQVVIEPQFEAAGSFNGDIAPVKKNGLWGYIHSSGQWIVEPKFSDAHPFSKENLALVEEGRAISFLDRQGHVAISSAKLIDAHNFSHGLAAVKVMPDSGKAELGKWGYVDQKGTMVISPQFDIASDFNGGLARVGLQKNDLHRGYINQAGVLIWDPADWQQSTTFNRRLYTGIFYGLTIYLFLFLRYLRWQRELKKAEIKQAEGVKKSPA